MTDELLQQLLSSATPEAYLSQTRLADRSLADYAHQLLTEKHLRRSDVIRASGLNTTFAYQVFQGTRMVGRDNAIMLAMGLRCTLQETQRLLRLAGVSELWCKVRRDAIIIFCIERRMSRAECDDELYRLGEDTLLSPEG
ncbi:MAG: XRE family transcriptional regulator [Atopobiaceae bacterium]|nr:XRE family transcriptional regulator [Atopobiaceae bacterium]